MTGTPARYDVVVRHIRTAPVRHEVTARMCMWLVDLDAVPASPGPLRWISSFRAADHVGDPGRSLRQNIEALLLEHGMAIPGGRITMLTSPRVFGYVFNPLSLFWCHRADGSLACVVAEVHNTYGGRYAYVLNPDEQGRVATAKRFYVSPFIPVDGHYTMSLPEPDDRLDVTVTLHLPEGRPFVASMRGTGHPASARGLLRYGLLHPFASRSTMAKIRRHGIALWLRRVPVVPRQAGATGRPGSLADRPLVGSSSSRREKEIS